MKDGFIRIGCASFEIQLGHIEYNALQIIDYVKKANLEGIKILSLS